MTAEKKRVAAAVCILFLLALAALTGCAAPKQTVGFPVAAAISGGAEGIAPAENLTVVPAEIWEKALARPDMMAYAANFCYYAEKDLNMDISADVTAGEVPLLLQWDHRWGYEMYGTNYMGLNGCAPTALTIVYAGLTGNTDVNPYDMAMYAQENGLYLSGQGTKWELMEVGGSYLGLRVQRIWKDQNAIRQALADGKLLTVRVGKGDFTDGGHFLVVCGIDENDLLEIRDPNSPEKTAQPWELDRVLEQATCFWSFGT